jgi:hypothetical protein
LIDQFVEALNAIGGVATSQQWEALCDIDAALYAACRHAGVEIPVHFLKAEHALSVMSPLAEHTHRVMRCEARMVLPGMLSPIGDQEQ